VGKDVVQDTVHSGLRLTRFLGRYDRDDRHGAWLAAETTRQQGGNVDTGEEEEHTGGG
jgi:hypothetical protein